MLMKKKHASTFILLSVVLATVFMQQESLNLTGSLQTTGVYCRGHWVEHYVNFSLFTKVFFIWYKNILPFEYQQSVLKERKAAASFLLIVLVHFDNLNR